MSQATLYSYFPDKRLLFLEVAKGECCRQARESSDPIPCKAAPATVLTEAATRMVEFFLSDFGMRVFRICVAESDRFPELGREFYRNGPALARSRLVEYFHEAEARGELRITDKDLGRRDLSCAIWCQGLSLVRPGRGPEAGRLGPAALRSG